MKVGQNITGVREGVEAIIQVDLEESTSTTSAATFKMQEDRLADGGLVTKTLGAGIAKVGNFLEITIPAVDSADIVGTDQITRKMAWQLEANLGSGSRPISEGDITWGKWA